MNIAITNEIDIWQAAKDHLDDLLSAYETARATYLADFHDNAKSSQQIRAAFDVKIEARNAYEIAQNAYRAIGITGHIGSHKI